MWRDGGVTWSIPNEPNTRSSIATQLTFPPQFTIGFLTGVYVLSAWSRAYFSITLASTLYFAGGHAYASIPTAMSSSTPAVSSALAVLRLLVISRPDDAWWSFFLVWLIRFLTISIVLRTFIVPWGLRLLFSRFRVRSVSLRSIRGVYFRQGRNVWNIDRIGLSYHRPSNTQASRLTVVVQGLRLEIAEPPNESAPPTPKPEANHRRRPTLADFSPSPIAFKARQIIYAIYAGLEPYFRPLIRAIIILALRALIRCLPALTQVLDFELISGELSLAELPDIQFNLKELGVSTKVVFTQVEEVAFKPRTSSSRPLHRKHSRFLSMVDWKSRLSDNVSRTWAGAWGNTRGTLSLTIHLNDLSATQSSNSQNSLSFHKHPLERLNNCHHRRKSSFSFSQQQFPRLSGHKFPKGRRAPESGDQHWLGIDQSDSRPPAAAYWSTQVKKACEAPSNSITTIKPVYSYNSFHVLPHVSRPPIHGRR